MDAANRVANARAFFARYVAARGAVRDPRVAEAFAAVPREVFAGPGPWSISVVGPLTRGATGPRHVQTVDDDPAVLYQDVLIALDTARGLNIGEPTLHAHCLDALAPAPGETVLQVGAGSGYYSAILAHLVGKTGRVHAFEIDTDLGARAQRNLSAYPQVSVVVRSGAEGPLPAVDAIYVNAGLARPADAWLDALRAGGRLLFPLQPQGGWGAMLLARKPVDGGARWPARFVCRASFVPCQAPAEAGTSEGGLAAAFAGGGLDRVASLCLGTQPDDTCWFRGSNWWLSSAAP